MPTLILRQNGIVCGGPIEGPVYIGRRGANSLVVLDPAVSRLHAWIGREEDHYFIADAASRTGTFVNDQRLSGRRELHDQDRIRIGPAELIFQSSDRLPPSVWPVRFTQSTHAERGIFWVCQCGQLMWAASNLAGRSAHCASCGAKMKIPGRPAQAPASKGHAMAAVTHQDEAESITCGVCQSPIGAGEAIATCGECGSSYHQACWEENRGCASYGCGQVNALAEGAEEVPADSLAAAEVEAPSPAFPWEFLLLGGAAVSIPVGALAYGVPGLFIAVGSALSLKRARRRGVVWGALGLAVAGLVLGVVASLFWWNSIVLW